MNNTRKIDLLNGYTLDENSTDSEIVLVSQKAFKTFTKGTNPEMSYIDKLLFVDELRERLNDTTDYQNLVKRVIGEMAFEEWQEHQTDSNILIDSDILNEEVFNRAKSPLNTSHMVGQSHSAQARYKYVIFKIIQTIFNIDSSIKK